MSDRPKNSSVVLVAILVFFLLLGGVGIYLETERQRAILAEQAAVAQAQELQARLAAEENRAKAAAALENQKNASDHEPLPEGEDAIRTAIETVFRAQQDAWNLGDVEAFMEHYWKSDDLTFSAGGKTTRGWQATFDRYKERYPTRDAMGQLTLGEFELFPLGDSAALVLGEWKLDRETEPVSGNFSLVLRKIDGRWMIVHDHTSRLGE